MTNLRLLQMIVFLGMATLFGASGAFSGDCKEKDCKGDGPGPVAKSISWEELKERCAHPTQFDVQRPPQNIRIQCSESRFAWVASSSVEVSMPSVRKVITGVLADKFVVGAEQKELQFYSKPGTCQKFRKIEEILSIERPVSCSDLLGMKGDLGDLCLSMLDVMKNSNPKLVEVRETPEVMDSCAGLGAQHHPDKPEPK